MIRPFNNLCVNIFIIPAIILSACSAGRQAAGVVTENDIRNAIDSGKWVFTVQQVMPLYGRARQPNGIYTVSYNGEKLEVYLPYFGRATGSVDTYTGRGPLDFSSNKPAINKKEVKPGEWRVELQPDNREIQTMDFSFYSNGTAHLAVRMNSRSGISYGGTVRPLKKE